MDRNILVLGCGGIGSFVARGLSEIMESGQIDNFTETITLADNDIIEVEQLAFQNFEMGEVGDNKAKALANRYSFKAIPKRIEQESQLKGYSLILVCADNDKARELVIRYAHKHKVDFIDLRSTGKRIFAMPKTTLEDNLRFINPKDTESHSCQDDADRERGWVSRGNKIVAEIGIQMLLNIERGQSNRTITLTV